MHIVAAKAVALGEALDPSFKEYAAQVLKNAKAMEQVFKERGIDMVSGGTDSHLILLDLRSKGLTGKEVCDALARVHIICNKMPCRMIRKNQRLHRFARGNGGRHNARLWGRGI